MVEVEIFAVQVVKCPREFLALSFALTAFGFAVVFRVSCCGWAVAYPNIIINAAPRLR